MGMQFSQIIEASRTFGNALAELGMENQPTVALSYEDGMRLWSVCEPELVRDAEAGAVVSGPVKWARIAGVRYEWPVVSSGRT